MFSFLGGGSRRGRWRGRWSSREWCALLGTGAVAVTASATSPRHSLTRSVPSVSPPSPSLPLSLSALLTHRVSLSDSPCPPSSERQMSFDEFSAQIKSSVARIRARHAPAGQACELLIWAVAGRPGAQSIELKLPRDGGGGEWVGAVAEWLRVLASHGSVELHSQGEDGRVISFVAVPSDQLNRPAERQPSVSLTVCNHTQPSLTLFRDGGFSHGDMKLLLDGYEHVLKTYKPASIPHRNPLRAWHEQHHPQQQQQQQQQQHQEAKDPIDELRALGVDVYCAKDNNGHKRMTWDDLAGYSIIKKEIKETVLIPLKHPEVYDNVVKFTREHVERNRPKAILLEGPPGTGKTLTAKIIASECDKAMVHLPVESIASKWYGESEKKLSQIFDACDKLGGAIIFIDEIDSLVGSRDSGDMHEATRRILSVILQRVEGFQGSGNNILIGATNRKQDLDAALISRFDTCIRYQLPDQETRLAILRRYAKHLGRVALYELSSQSEGFSSRDLKELCEQAERRWAAAAISRNDPKELKEGLPSSTDYLESLQNKKNSLQM